MPIFKRTSPNTWPLRALAASAVCLYLLINAFLILCLAHPHNTHFQGHADSHPISGCAWVHKTVASHVPSSGIILAFVGVALLVSLQQPQYRPQISLVRLTGRSPPLLALA